MKKVIQLLSVTILLFVLTSCTKKYDNVLKYYNDSKIVKIEFVEYRLEESNENYNTYFEKYISLEVEDLDSYIEETNSLVCKSSIIKDYYWQGSGDIKYYYEDGSTLKWDGTRAKYIDKSGKQTSKYFENDLFWYILDEYINMSLDFNLIINNQNYAPSRLNTIWNTENDGNTISFGEASTHIYGYIYDDEKIDTESIVYDNKEYVTKRIEAKQIDVTEDVVGLFKYKDSTINVKFDFYFSKDVVRSKLYFLDNETGINKPNHNDDGLILTCLIKFEDNKLILNVDSNSADKFIDIFGKQEVEFFKDITPNL